MYSPPVVYDFSRVRWAVEHLYKQVRAQATCAYAMQSSTQVKNPPPKVPPKGPTQASQVYKPPQSGFKQPQISLNLPKKMLNLRGNLQIKRGVKTNETATVIELPQFIRDAIQSSGLNVAGLNTGAYGVRIFRDSQTPLNPVTYQYFPVIPDKAKAAEPALVVVGNSRPLPRCDVSVPYGVTDPNVEEGGDRVINVHYNSKVFIDSGDSFLPVLDFLISYLSYNMGHVFPNDVYIDFFSEYQLGDISYTYALAAALLGGPSGCYYTGSLQGTYEDFNVAEIDQNVLEVKANSASPNCPLFALGKDLEDNQLTGLASGFFPSEMEGKLLSTNNLAIALLTSMVPLSARLVKRTPADKYMQDGTKLAGQTSMSNAHKFFLAAVTNKIQAIKEMLEGTKKFTYNDVKKGNPAEFVAGWVNPLNGHGWLISDLIMKGKIKEEDPALIPLRQYRYMRKGDLMRAVRKLTVPPIFFKKEDYSSLKAAEDEKAKITEQDITEMLNSRNNLLGGGHLPKNIVSTTIQKFVPNEDVNAKYSLVADYAIPFAQTVAELANDTAGFTGKSYQITNAPNLTNALTELGIKYKNRAPITLTNKHVALVKFMEKLPTNGILYWLQVANYPVKDLYSQNNAELEVIQKALEERPEIMQFWQVGNPVNLVQNMTRKEMAAIRKDIKNRGFQQPAIEQSQVGPTYIGPNPQAHQVIYKPPAPQVAQKSFVSYKPPVSVQAKPNIPVMGYPSIVPSSSAMGKGPRMNIQDNPEEEGGVDPYYGEDVQAFEEYMKTMSAPKQGAPEASPQ
jgi:hypothetical protein